MYKKKKYTTENIKQISEHYLDDFQQILILANQMGISTKQVQNNPPIILWLFYEWLDCNKKR